MQIITFRNFHIVLFYFIKCIGITASQVSPAIMAGQICICCRGIVCHHSVAVKDFVTTPALNYYR